MGLGERGDGAGNLGVKRTEETARSPLDARSHLFKLFTAAGGQEFGKGHTPTRGILTAKEPVARSNLLTTHLSLPRLGIGERQ